jgi:precorrin-6A/cobalt-precorrin-6A reductase
MLNILILGGTGEARQLAGELAGKASFKVTLSLAGRTAQPAAQPVQIRIRGFGGVDGLVDYLVAHRVDVLVDATHPYAATMSAHAAEAAARTKVPILALRRPPWKANAADRWIEADNVDDAVRALGAAPQRVFLTIGRQEVHPFEAAPQHRYLIRSVDPIQPPLDVPHATYIVARGPFNDADERATMIEYGIDRIVAKNSGGSATYSKIAAARALGITVVMLRRPTLPAVPSVETVQDAAAWLDHALASGAERGV